MLVEFTGCSGAGKTTLVRRVDRLLRERGINVASPLRLVIGPRFSPLAATCSCSTRVENVVLELLSCLRAVVTSAPLVAADTLMRRWICEAAESRPEWWRLTRSWNRKLAVLTYWDSHPDPSCHLLLDEGPVHLAISLLSRWLQHPADALEQFLQTVPIPDCVVCVEASLQCREMRLAARSMQPAPDRIPSARRRYLARCDQLTSHLCRHPWIAAGVLRVTNDGDDPAAVDELAQHIAQHLALQCACSPTGIRDLPDIPPSAS